MPTICTTAVKALDPKVAVLFNIKGVYSFNRYWTNAVYQPLVCGEDRFDGVRHGRV